MSDPVAERFWSYVKKTETCWEWTRQISQIGYGRFFFRKKGWMAHRVSWTLSCGEIPPGLFVLHHCDVRRCVRPDHLFLGTQKQNIQDAVRKGRMATGDRHGQRLHPERVARGEHSGKSKLTEEQVREIRYRRNVEGELVAVLAADYHVAESRICAIAAYKEWKHVRDEVFA